MCIILKCYEYFYVNKMKKTKLVYNYVTPDDDEKITHMLYYKRNLTMFPFMIGEIISHSDVVCLTNKDNAYIVLNDSAKRKNAINVYLIDDATEHLTFQKYKYKLNEIIVIDHDVLLKDFLDKFLFSVNKFDYDILGYNCHMIFLDTLAYFNIKSEKKNICGFLPILNQIVIDIFNPNTYF